MNEPRRPHEWMDEQLRIWLQRPRPPAELEAKLLHTLDQQVQGSAAAARGWQIGFAASLAANVLLGIWLLTMHFDRIAPEFVHQARTHLEHEQGLEGMLDNTYSSWLRERNTELPSGEFQIAMAKNCAVGAVEAKHLRLVTDDRGTINVFVYAADMPDGLQGTGSGMLHGQRWITLQPNAEVAVLVFFDQKTSPQRVTELLADMYPHLKTILI